MKSTVHNNPAIPFKLGNWIIQPALNELSQPKKTKTIESKAMDTLLYLKANRSKPVSNNELLENVWKDTIVSENNVRRVITQLRKALEDDVSQPQYIKTVPKRGYKLVASVEPYSNKEFNKLSKPTLIGILVIIVSLFILSLKGIIFNNSDNGLIKNIDAIESDYLTQVTHLIGYAIMPSLSPDAKYMLFTHESSKEKGPRIYWRDLNQLTNIPVKGIAGKAISPKWSPNGQHVAYVDLSGNKCQVAVAKVKQLGKEFEQAKLIAPCDLKTLSRLVWKNNLEFFYRPSSNSTDAAKVTLYNINTKHHQLLSLYTEQPNLQLIHVATPLTQLINTTAQKVQKNNLFEYAYIVRNGFNSDLWVKQPHMKAEIIHQFKGNVRAIAFCGLEQRLTVMQYDSLWYLSSDGLNQTQKFQKHTLKLPNRLAYLSCSANSEDIVFSARKFTSNIHIIDNPIINKLNTSKKNKFKIEQHHLQPSSGSNSWPSFANNSNELAFVSNRNNDWELYLSKNGELSNILKQQTIKLQGYPFIWSPDDSKALIMQADQTLSLFDINENSFNTIATAEDNIFTLEWAHNGDGIYYVPMESREIHYLDLSSGKRKVISKIKATDIMSVNENTLYFTKADDAGLWRLNIKTGENSLIISETNNNSQFRVFEKGIYFNARVGHPAAIFYFSFETQSITELFPDIQEEYGHQLTISHDQSLIAYSQYDNYQANIYQLKKKLPQ